MAITESFRNWQAGALGPTTATLMEVDKPGFNTERVISEKPKKKKKKPTKSLTDEEIIAQKEREFVESRMSANEATITAEKERALKQKEAEKRFRSTMPLNMAGSYRDPYAFAESTFETPEEMVGEEGLKTQLLTSLKTDTENLKKTRGFSEDAPAPAEVETGKGDGITTDKAGKTTPTTAEDDAAQNASASSQAAKDLQNDAVKADDDAKVGQGVLGDATKTWWFNVTDSLGDALINYGINFAASGGDRGKAFAAAGQTLAGGFDKYDRRQQIDELKSMGYTDAEIMNYINTSQLSTPIFAKAGRKGGSTESQQKAEGGASRADFVNKTWGNKYGKLASAGDYPLSTRTGQVRGMFDEQGMVRKIFDFANPEYAKAFKDEMGYLAGVLRPESGSAIGQMEWENYGHIYFPRYGDTQEDIARKGLLRQMTIKTLQSMGDPTDQEASLAVDQLTSYADRVIDYDPETEAYMVEQDNGNIGYLIID